MKHESSLAISVLPRSIPVRRRHLVPRKPASRRQGTLFPALTQERIPGAPLPCGNLKIPTDDPPLRFVKTKRSLSIPD